MGGCGGNDHDTLSCLRNTDAGFAAAGSLSNPWSSGNTDIGYSCGGRPDDNFAFGMTVHCCSDNVHFSLGYNVDPSGCSQRDKLAAGCHGAPHDGGYGPCGQPTRAPTMLR